MGFQVAGAGTAGRQGGGWSKRLALCWQKRCWVEDSEPHLWTVRSPGRERTRSSRTLAVIQGLPFLNAHVVPHTVLMIIITMFIEHPLETGLCFSEAWLSNPHRDPGREVLPFPFMGRLGHMLQVPLLETGRGRSASAAACWP